MSNPLVISLAGVPVVPHIDQYLGEWAIEPQRFESLMAMAANIGLAEHVKNQQAKAALRIDGESNKKADKYQIIDGVALIELNGAMTKYGSSMSDNAGSVAIRRSIRQATADTQVKAILLRIDSPGGTVSGTHDLADEVAAANAVKPVTAFIEDLGASAAYWVASQAGRVVANKASALVGSIGTYGVLYDQSQQAEKMGIKAIVVKAGEHKAAGAWGTQITPEQVAETQRVIDSLNNQFKASVMNGRRMNQAQVDKIADGRIHTADQALTLGLIDAIQSMDQAIAALAKPSTTRPPQTARATHEESTVTNKTTDTTTVETPAQAAQPATPAAAQPATLKELKVAFPKASSDFYVECMDKGLTLAQAKDARIAALEATASAKDEEIQTIKTQAAAKAGVKPLVTQPSKAGQEASDQSATERWNEAVDKKVKAGMTKARAISAVASTDPDLQAAFLEEVNANRTHRK
jgi:signal peptide peptidase SppA